MTSRPDPAPGGSWAGTRASYDVVAEDYDRAFRDELDRKPRDRELLAALAAACAPGPVADLGGGPGHVAAHLTALGAAAVVVDLSPGMCRLAGRRVPAAAGDLVALPLADRSLAGAVAFYSLIHLRPERLPDAFAEVRRVLRPGGRWLVAVHGGDGPLEADEFLGHPVPFRATRLGEAAVAAFAREAGLAVDLRFTRQPYADEHGTPRVYVGGERPSEGAGAS